MKNLKSIVITVVGAGAIALAMTLNLRHAINDYGVLSGKLNIEVLAQSGTSGGGYGSGTGSGTVFVLLPHVSFLFAGHEWFGQGNASYPAIDEHYYPKIVECYMPPVINTFFVSWSLTWPPGGGSHWESISVNVDQSRGTWGYKVDCILGFGNCASISSTGSECVWSPWMYF